MLYMRPGQPLHGGSCLAVFSRGGVLVRRGVKPGPDSSGEGERWRMKGAGLLNPQLWRRRHHSEQIAALFEYLCSSAWTSASQAHRSPPSLTVLCFLSLTALWGPVIISPEHSTKRRFALFPPLFSSCCGREGKTYLVIKNPDFITKASERRNHSDAFRHLTRSSPTCPTRKWTQRLFV